MQIILAELGASHDLLRCDDDSRKCDEADVRQHSSSDSLLAVYSHGQLTNIHVVPLCNSVVSSRAYIPEALIRPSHGQSIRYAYACGQGFGDQ